MGCGSSKPEVHVHPDEPAPVDSGGGVGVVGSGGGDGGGDGVGVSGQTKAQTHPSPTPTPPSPHAGGPSSSSQAEKVSGVGQGGSNSKKGGADAATEAPPVGSMAQKDGELFRKSMKEGGKYLFFTAARAGDGVLFKAYNPKTSATLGKQMSFSDVRELLGEDAGDDDASNVASLGKLMYTDGDTVKFKPAPGDTFDGTAVQSPVSLERPEDTCPVQVARKSRKMGDSFYIFNACLIEDGKFQFDMFSAMSTDKVDLVLSRGEVEGALSGDEKGDGTDKAMAIGVIKKLKLEEGKLFLE